MIDYVFRYDPDKTHSKPAPRDADQARAALDDGNRLFSRWMESCHTGTIPEPEAQYIVPCSGPEMGIVRALEDMPKQKPFAVVVGCSNARVPTEMLFGQGFNNCSSPEWPAAVAHMEIRSTIFRVTFLRLRS
jgi:carbonic anhydrase